MASRSHQPSLVRRMFGLTAPRTGFLGLALPAVSICSAALVGCTTGDGADPVWSEGTTILVVADWDDVPAAVSAGLGQRRWTVLDATGPTRDKPEGEFRYELVDKGDRPGVLAARRRAGASSAEHGPVGIELSAKLGRFGDAAEERALLNAVRARLTDLTGVDVAPLR